MSKKSSKKTFDTVYILLEELSISLAGLFDRYGMTPNQITVLRFMIFAVPAGILLFIGTHFTNIAAILLFFLNSFFDIVDGSLARNFDKKSKLGAFLDVNLDFITFDMIFLAITLNMFLVDHPLKYFGILALFSLSLSLKITDIFEKKFQLVPIGGSEVFHDAFTKSKPDVISKVLREMIYPTSTISYFFLTFRYLLVVGALLNILPIALAIHSVVLFTRALSLFLLLCLYESTSALRRRFVIVSILQKVDKE